MDTSLDILSEAASLVQSQAIIKGPVKRRAMNHRSPSKELPTKMSRNERIKDRHHTPPLGGSDDHINRKCAGTQTPFSSFVHESPPPPCQSGSMVYPMGDAYQAMDKSCQDSIAPLNLTVSSSQQARPSVITCAPSASTPPPSHNNNNSNRTPATLHKQTGGLCDPAIEEHFRRSLGSSYPGLYNPSPPPAYPIQPPAPPSPPSPEPVLPPSPTQSASPPHNVSVTGSVDDHFARALGDTWDRIKPAGQDNPNQMFAGSVDDHFAKALGQSTWLRIKAGKEDGQGSRSSSPHSPRSPRSPASHQSMVPT